MSTLPYKAGFTYSAYKRVENAGNKKNRAHQRTDLQSRATRVPHAILEMFK